MTVKDFHSYTEKKPIIHILSEVMKRKIPIVLLSQHFKMLRFLGFINTTKGNFKTISFVITYS